MVPEFKTPNIADVFAKFDEKPRVGLLKLRKLIFECAAEMPAVGPIEEALRWGQPAYLTPATKSGSTLRLGVPKAASFAIFAHCQTTIISTFAQTFVGMDKIDGNRAILFDHIDEIDPARISMLIKHALGYHLGK